MFSRHFLMRSGGWERNTPAHDTSDGRQPRRSASVSIIDLGSRVGTFAERCLFGGYRHFLHPAVISHATMQHFDLPFVIQGAFHPSLAREVHCHC